MPKKKCCCEYAPGTIYRLDPCYDRAEDDCQHCAGNTPKLWTLTFADVVNDDCCPDTGTPPLTSFQPLGAIPSPLLLSQDAGDPCTWRYAEADPDKGLRFWVDSPICAGANTIDSPATYLGVKLVITAGQVRLYAYYIYQSYTSDGWFDATIPLTDCGDGHNFTNEVTECHWSLIHSGTARALPGDVHEADAATKCTGGEPIYTDTDLSAYIGKVVELTADGHCYQVSVDIDDNESDGAVAVTATADNCEDCCTESGSYTVL